MEMSRVMRILLVIGNICVIILAIVIMSLSLGYWHEYTGGAISILVGILGLIVVCLYNHIIIIGYAVLLAIDFLILLANAIVLTILKSGIADYCFNNDGDKSPLWGCHDWRDNGNGHYKRATGVMVCLFISVVLRALNFASACLLARAVYEDQYEGGMDDTRKPDTHDLGERGRQF
jgi:hypothetical protein